MLTSMTLNGLWKFCPAFDYLVGDQRWTDSNFDLNKAKDTPNPKPSADIGWINPGFDDSGWMDHPVPASWNKTFEDLFSYEGHGWYRREIRVPEDWEGKRVVFFSYGANYLTKIYVNGQFAGEHEGGYNPFEIPVQDFLKPGEVNTIAAHIDNVPKSDRCPGGQHDWWNHGGLFRDVELRVSDAAYIDDVFVVTEVGVGEGADGKDTCDVTAKIDVGYLDGAQGAERVAAVEFRDPSGLVMDIDIADAAVEGGKAVVEFTVDPARLWDMKNPNLYEITVLLKDPATGKVGDIWKHKIGLRTFKVVGKKMLLNGEPFIVKGANRYEDFPETGKTFDEKLVSRDLDLMEWMGGNAFRSHYPCHKRHYELCDERGFLNLIEVPFYQWGRPLVETADINALPTAKQQLTEIIKHYKNHPSVFMWCVANESLTRTGSQKQEDIDLAKQTADGLIEMVKLGQSLDPTRPVVEVSNSWPQDPVFAATDVSAVNVYVGTKTPHAKDIDDVKQRMHEKMQLLHDENLGKPILVTEFGTWTMRGMKTDYFPGEAFQSAKLKAMWEQTIAEEDCFGAFIWVFADSDVHRRFLWVYEFRCSYGMFDFHRRPKEAAYTMRELWKD